MINEVNDAQLEQMELESWEGKVRALERQLNSEEVSRARAIRTAAARARVDELRQKVLDLGLTPAV